MKAIFLNSVAGPEALGYGETPRPQPAAGQVLVEVFATAIMPTELQWEPTWKQRSGQPRPFPLILSHEFSGTVEVLGPEVAGFELGEAVYVVSIMEFGNGKVVHETQYFAEPFEAPAWCARWVKQTRKCKTWRS